MAIELRSPGTYLLLMGLPRRVAITVRSRREFALEPGRYVYLGSARGTGGLATRLRRHSAESARKHWHIDFLVPHVDVDGAVVALGADRLECRWASWVDGTGAACVAGFGASDCRCTGHLFRIGGHGGADRFVRVARDALGGQYVPGDALGLPGR